MISMDTMPLRWGHYRVLIVASLGQMIGTGLATMIGIVIPLIQIAGDPHLSAFEQGVLGCLSLLGIMAGSTIFGRLSDRFGYLFFFRLCPFLVLVFALLGWYMKSADWLAVCLFMMGFGIGGEYSLDSDYISELMPAKWTKLMVGIAKACCSLGGILVALLCFLILKARPEASSWSTLLLVIAGIAFVMLVLRIRFRESPRWLLEHGCPQEAEQAVQYFLGDDVTIYPPQKANSPQAIASARKAAAAKPAPLRTLIGPHLELGEIRARKRKADAPKVSFGALFKGENLKRVIASGVPWACEGLGVYGIGTFLPVLVMALGIERILSSAAPGVSPQIEHIIVSVEITILINFFILPGFAAGLWLLNKVYGISLLVWGFILSAAGLLILVAGYMLKLPVWVSLLGFAVFEVFLNMGPHLMTFVLPSEIYPVADRGEGAGLAASVGKLGATVGVLFIPLLLAWGGMGLVLWVCIGVQLLGALIAFVYGREVLPRDGGNAAKTAKSAATGS